mmetsp:Transcript_12329/g.34850  ORF Transcript_12329/g.34850 Transcript_12329/m.34850 type:complete len:265 (-) Transcript_12329:324-1118(-)
MKLTCVTISGEVAEVEVAGETTFEDLKRLAAIELGLDSDNVNLAFKGETDIPDTATVDEVGLEANDMIAVSVAGGSSSDEGRRTSLRNSLSRVSGSNLEEQLYIQRQIQLQNIQENMERAFEESPEAFASVLMLYIPVEVNNTPVKAFVDSGAQTTVMSRECAERCGIMRLVDPRFAGIAVGVGHARILGRVHLAPIKIGSQVFNCSFTVLDGQQNMELLLGLDMLRKHQMLIDLRNDCLHVGDTDELIPFLSESDVPEHARLH